MRHVSYTGLLQKTLIIVVLGTFASSKMSDWLSLQEFNSPSFRNNNCRLWGLVGTKQLLNKMKKFFFITCLLLGSVATFAQRDLGYRGFVDLGGGIGITRLLPATKKIRETCQGIFYFLKFQTKSLFDMLKKALRSDKTRWKS